MQIIGNLFLNKVSNLFKFSLQHPWSVSLIEYFSVKGGEERFPMLKCSGSIVNVHFVLSAAHCVKRGIDLTQYRAVTGATRVERRAEEAEFRVEHEFTRGDVFIHPKYDGVKIFL